MGNRRGGLPCPPRTPPARHRSLPPAADSLRPFEQWRWGRFVLAVWRAGAGGLAGGGALLPPLSPPAFSPAPARLPAVSTRFPLPPLHKRPSLNSGGIRRPRKPFASAFARALCFRPIAAGGQARLRAPPLSVGSVRRVGCGQKQTLRAKNTPQSQLTACTAFRLTSGIAPFLCFAAPKFALRVASVEFWDCFA